VSVDERVYRSIRLKVEKVVEIGRFFRLKCFVGERENFVGCADTF